MGKGAGVFVASLVAMTFTALVACKGDDDQSTFEEKFPTTDAEPPGSTFSPDSGKGDTGGQVGPTSCAPKIPDPFNPTYTAPAKVEACDDTELAGYYDACLLNPGDATADQKCKDWRAAHDTCTKCIEPDTKTGPIQWSLDRKLLNLNVAGCVGLVSLADGGTSDCAEAYDKAVQCTRQACEWCIEAGGAYTAYQTCQTTARGTGVCATLETARQSKCAGITGTSGSAKICFPAQGETEKDHYVRVEGIFCGKSQQ